MSKWFYCSNCGKELSKNDIICRGCKKRIIPKESKYDGTYYINKSAQLYGCSDYAFKILLQEESNIIISNNQPKCPTCGSTNIQNISTVSKVAGAAMFGLFSKTAKSQFKCNNCGYKW